MLYGSRTPQSAPRVEYAAKPLKQRRRKGDLNAVCDRQQARAEPLLFKIIIAYHLECTHM